MIMKRLISIILLLSSYCSFSQTQVDSIKVKTSFTLAGKRVTAISNDTTSRSSDSSELITKAAARKLKSTGATADTTNGTYLTKTQGDNFYVKVLTQNPTASLSGGVAQERVASGSALSYTLSWSGGRQNAGTNVLATNPLTTIVVATVSQSFSQPSVGSSVSGTQSVSVTRNTTTTYTNTVTTTDSKTASATTTFSFYDKRYVGWSTTTTPTDAEILAAVFKDNNGGTVSLSQTLTQLGSAAHLFYANTAQVSSITINGFPSTSSFSINNSRSFTNASGGTTTYYVSVSNNAIGNTGTTSITIN
jgi:hypothetical protein